MVAASTQPSSAPDVRVALPQPRPGFLEPHAFEKTFVVTASPEAVWDWLEDPATFVDDQWFPFRVEFVAVDPAIPAGFHVGGMNLHHGPLMCFAGILTEIREGAYRELQYLYGSYVLSLRWIRPARLEFWVEPAEGSCTRVRLRVESYVRPGLARPWSWAQRVFWSRFPRWMARALHCETSA